MSVTGLCQVCMRNDAQFSCTNCGNIVCEDHYDADTGLCVSCAETDGSPQI